MYLRAKTYRAQLNQYLSNIECLRADYLCTTLSSLFSFSPTVASSCSPCHHTQSFHLDHAAHIALVQLADTGQTHNASVLFLHCTNAHTRLARRHTSSTTLSIACDPSAGRAALDIPIHIETQHNGFFRAAKFRRNGYERRRHETFIRAATGTKRVHQCGILRATGLESVRSCHTNPASCTTLPILVNPSVGRAAHQCSIPC
jgi:hypothetical protein